MLRSVNCTWLLMFWVPRRSRLYSLALENGIDMLSRNVGTLLTTCAS